GSAPRGAVNEPFTINSFADYERTFGGLSLDSTMSYAVRDFYLNGGSQAIIVRLNNGGQAATITLPANGSPPGSALVLEAASVGAWGNRLSALVDHNTRDSANQQLFNLTVSEQGGATEKFLNVSVDQADPRYLPRVLEQNSMLARVRRSGGQYQVPSVRPLETFTMASPPSSPPQLVPAPVAADGLGSDGTPLTFAQFIGPGLEGAKQGLFALEKADLFNLLCLPPFSLISDMTSDVLAAGEAYCRKRRAMLLVDPPGSWTNKTTARNEFVATTGVIGATSRNAALFFPRLRQPNPLRDNQLEEFVPCGAVAGIFARTDSTRGVWKAPAGQEANLVGVPALSVSLTDDENGELNPLGLNCLRSFPVIGRVVWGARTLDGADRLASEWKYIPVRRTALFIEESLYRGTQWVVFEPNDEPLWAQIRLNVGAFMQNLFRQ
ncbi:MAG: phage tail sheath subtilisin-like domain-containing protein, partial [Acidobacteria bacterium]|nr:phage tail sheath subtilisin-like domain-containing protein [Acidobacteriota bacterium]